jgi:hypothetical protein
MTYGHIWMFAAYVAWVDCMSGAWMYPPRPRKVDRKKC